MINRNCYKKKIRKKKWVKNCHTLNKMTKKKVKYQIVTTETESIKSPEYKFNRRIDRISSSKKK